VAENAEYFPGLEKYWPGSSEIGKFKIGLFETVSDLDNLDKVVRFRKLARFGVLTCVLKFQKL
jgi:hypothetical protein